MSILITGSLGLIGRVLKERIPQSKESVVEMDIRLKSGIKKNNDICRFDFDRADLADVKGVIHLAGISRIAWGEMDPNLCYEINVEGTKRVVEFCKSHRNNPWIIHASSREVYGQQKKFPVSESAFLIAANAYARTKIESEKIIAAASNIGVRGLILRFSNVYGGLHDHFDRVIPSFVINALNGNDLMIYGPECIFDFTNVEDVVDGILLAKNYLDVTSKNDLKTIHLTTGTPTSLSAVANIVVSATNSRSRLINLQKRSYSTSKFWGDNSLAKNLLGWSPKIPIEIGLKSFIAKLEEFRDREDDDNPILRESLNENFKSYTWLPSEVQRRI